MGMAIARCVTSIDQTEEMLEGSVWADREAVSPKFVGPYSPSANLDFIDRFHLRRQRPYIYQPLQDCYLETSKDELIPSREWITLPERWHDEKQSPSENTSRGYTHGVIHKEWD